MPFLMRLLVNAAALWVATRVVPGPQPVYVMFLEATVPAGADPAVVEADLKALAADLSVDVSFHPLETETL